MQGINMKKHLDHIIVLLSILTLCACSSANKDAPLDGQTHIANYLTSHSSEAEVDIENCKSCHGFDLSGRNNAVSCLTCHTDGEPITLHSMPFSDPVDHGLVARNGQRQCFGCHGTAPNLFDGGVLANPAIYNSPIANCSTAGCHSDAGAHPTRWQGSNDDTPGFHVSHRVVSQNTIDTSCSLCHQVTADGPQPLNDAPSCFSVSFTNGDGSTTGCHSSGPADTHDLPYGSADLHGLDAKADLAACQTCHGTPGSTSFFGGTSSTACDTCHTAAGAHPVRWQGTNDNTSDYLSTHRNAGKQSTTCATCHEVTPGNPGPNPDAPSCSSATFTNADGSATGCHVSGPGAAHPVPYTDPLQHGLDAKDDLASCVPCHAAPADAGAGDNPRFNVSIGSLTNGCEECHSANTAHPTPLWTGEATYSHKTANQMNVACALCHGSNLDGAAGGGTGPACVDCHTAGSPLTLTSCTSCHNWPPDGQSPAGDQYPNRNGAHGVHYALSGVNGNCSVCHQGSGTNTINHFNGGNPATVSIYSYYNSQSGVASYDAANQRCSSTRCHGGQTSPTWWSGSINVSTDCESCHSTSSGQYNSATSGRHRYHVVNRNLDCIDCHDASLLSTNHFSNLATTGFEGNPWDTLLSYLNYSHSTRQGCSVSGCHGTERW